MERKFIKKLILTATILMSTAALLTACGGSDRSRSNYDRRAYDDRWYRYDERGLRQSSCYDCGYGTVVADIVGQTNTIELKMEMGLSLYSESGYGPNDYYGGYSNYGGNFSSGRVYAEGFMSIYQHSNIMGCTMPDDDFEIETVSPGTLTGLTMSDNLTLEAYGLRTDVILEIRLHQVNLLQIGGYQGSDGYNYNLGFWGFADITMDDPRYGRCYVGYYMINTPSASGLF